MRVNPNPDEAWAIGILEGEGSFSITLNRGDGAYRLRASCGMTDEDVIQHLHEVFKDYSGTRRTSMYLHSGKPMYVWTIQKRADVIRFITHVQPYMSARRQAKIQELLDFDKANPIDPTHHRKNACT